MLQTATGGPSAAGKQTFCVIKKVKKKNKRNISTGFFLLFLYNVKMSPSPIKQLLLLHILQCLQLIALSPSCSSSVVFPSNQSRHFPLFVATSTSSQLTTYNVNGKLSLRA